MVAQPGTFGHLLFVGIGAVGMGLCLGLLPAKSDPFASPWSGQHGEKARMRLIAAGREHGIYKVAAEIRLPPTAITYWRTPGDAGVPPQFSIAESENVADAKVLFPAPRRIDEQGMEAFGYRGGVVFPIQVAARDASKPVRLRLTVAYAVCDNICIPEKSSAELILPSSIDSPQGIAFGTAEARVPLLLPASDLVKKVQIKPDTAAASPAWLLTWEGDARPTDLFAEAPEGWVLETHRRADGLFSIVEVQRPISGPVRRVPVQFTLTSPQKAYQFTIELELPKSSPVAAPAQRTTQAEPTGTK